MNRRGFLAAVLGVLVCGQLRLGALPQDAEPARRTAAAAEARGSAWNAECTFGADGAALALFAMPEGSRLSVGVRAGLGFEWADFRMNDPAAALAVRWRLLDSRRWAWWLGAEAGAALIDTGYDRFALPFVGASTGGRFVFGKRFSALAEVASRYGKRDLESQATLDFLEPRYAETLFIDPLVLRLGLGLSF